MASIKSARSRLALVFTALLLPTPAVKGCSCAERGGTAADEADYIRENSDWYKMMAIARFVNETSYKIVEEGGSPDLEPYPFTYQNTTFIVKEIVFNSDSSGTLLSSAIDIQPDGTMMYQTSTETTCCLCGRTLPAQNIGQDYLLPISISGGLSTCEIICNVEDEFCNGIAVELRDAEETSTTTSTTTITTTESALTTAAKEELEGIISSTTTMTTTTMATTAATVDASRDATTMTTTTTATTAATVDAFRDDKPALVEEPEASATMAAPTAAPTGTQEAHESSPGSKVKTTVTSLICGSAILLGFSS